MSLRDKIVGKLTEEEQEKERLHNQTGQLIKLHRRAENLANDIKNIEVDSQFSGETAKVHEDAEKMADELKNIMLDSASQLADTIEAKREGEPY
ncbi:MAG: hypothetical protein FH756_15855 [Firmicutes bacterium]|nr:hypothetical protein [Bacillota bacterium]